MTSYFCPICNSEKISLLNSHLFSSIRCLDCSHEAIVSKEENLPKFVNKTLKNNKIRPCLNECLEDVLEYSFCPYWTIMKSINKINSIRIRKKTNNLILIQSFSDKSISILSKNIMIPNEVKENEEFFIINLYK